ncbi:MAG TPA: metallophosphoesterase family protein [Paracoccaceae bacterium]|nr:metallophosphoesterase family protein [Paracoccaceae bacterium]
MRILAFSDMHLARHCADKVCAAAGEADLVIGAGDFAVQRNGLADAMTMLAPVLPKAVLVPGNAESIEELRAAAGPATVLHGDAVERDGVRLFGLGYAVPVTPFGPWSCDMAEAEAEAMLAAMEQADILIVHSPPRGLGDRTAAGASVGSTAIRAAIERVQPKLALCGHVHDSWGVSGMIGETRVHNLGPRPNWFEV